jgi:hypothetical protein|tara:strand:+ start:1376 stop:1786 length:411 start_codon:yes stop_codon:yes gene_type:complete
MTSPINIKTDNNRYFNPQNNEYLFKIILNLKNDTKKEIVKLTSTKYVKLIKNSDLVNYNEIKDFKIIIQNISNMISYNFESTFLNLDEDEEENFKTFRNSEIYLEFSKNINNNYTECNCYLNANDSNRIFVTPPNY